MLVSMAPNRAAVQFRRLLLSWASGSRRSFLWREGTASPYVVLVAEALLRKTRAESVEGVLRRLVRRYPRVTSLARARRKDVSGLLRPLGLHRIRTAALLGTARTVVGKYGGRVPRREKDLLELPHIGRYSANAILCFAYGRSRAIVDSNVARIYHRVFGVAAPLEIHKADELWRFARSLLPRRRVQEFNWALLDLGGLICTARRPRCGECPARRMCCAHLSGTCGCIRTGPTYTPSEM